MFSFWRSFLQNSFWESLNSICLGTEIALDFMMSKIFSDFVERPRSKIGVDLKLSTRMSKIFSDSNRPLPEVVGHWFQCPTTSGST